MRCIQIGAQMFPQMLNIGDRATLLLDRRHIGSNAPAKLSESWAPSPTTGKNWVTMKFGLHPKLVTIATRKFPVAVTVAVVSSALVFSGVTSAQADDPIHVVKQAITNATPASVGHAAIVQPKTSAKTVVAFAKGGVSV